MQTLEPTSGQSAMDDEAVLKADPDWAARTAYWRVRLGRLRLGVEPLELQLDRYYKLTWALTMVPLAIGLIIVAILTAFGAPLVGLITAGVLFMPVVAGAWLGYRRMSRAASEYLRERAARAARLRALAGSTPSPGGAPVVDPAD